MIAFPADVTFYWSFKIADNTWEPVNATTEGYNITNTVLTSYLFIDKFQPGQAGHYKVYGKNSLNTGRKYDFELRPYSKC